MTRDEAIKLNDELMSEVSCRAENLKLDIKKVEELIDQNIMIVPDDARKGILFLGEDSASYKIGNIKIDLKNALEAGIELLVSLNKPESIFNYIQLFLLAIIFVTKASKIEVGKVETHVVSVLHKKNAYDYGINEEELIDQLQDECGTCEDIVKAINNLYRIKVIEINDKKISLCEKVWGDPQ